jgi:hypothetical protein
MYKVTHRQCRRRIDYPTSPQRQTMDTLVHQLAPPVEYRAADDGQQEDDGNDLASWGSAGGFGMLGKGGVIKGMQVPRVPDVSGRLFECTPSSMSGFYSR